MTRAVVVMGVSGCGKTTLGAALAACLGWRFVEGDTLHPPANVAKMRAGIALGDEDRRPQLEGVAQVLAEAQGAGIVVSCSALRRSYRELIRTRAGNVAFVLPVLDRDRLLERLARRQDHFMPPSLLESQLATLELPEPEERVILIDGTAATEVQVTAALNVLQNRGSTGAAA